MNLQKDEKNDDDDIIKLRYIEYNKNMNYWGKRKGGRRSCQV